MDELASSTAETQAFAQASELVQQAVGIFTSTRARIRPSLDGGEGSLAHYQEHMFIDHSPLVGPLNPLAPPIVISADGTKVTGVVTFGAAYEGPPGCVHGGFIAAAFDEVLGLAQGMWGAGHDRPSHRAVPLAVAAAAGAALRRRHRPRRRTQDLHQGRACAWPPMGGCERDADVADEKRHQPVKNRDGHALEESIMFQTYAL